MVFIVGDTAGTEDLTFRVYKVPGDAFFLKVLRVDTNLSTFRPPSTTIISFVLLFQVASLPWPILYVGFPE